MTLWGRFDHAGSVGFGTIDGDTITIHEGDMFAGAKDTTGLLRGTLRYVESVPHHTHVVSLEDAKPWREGN